MVLLASLEQMMLQGAGLVSQGRIAEAALVYDQARWTLTQTLTLSCLGTPPLPPPGVNSATTTVSSSASFSDPQVSTNGPCSSSNPASSASSPPAPKTILIPNPTTGSVKVDFFPHPNECLRNPYEIDFFPFPIVFRCIASMDHPQQHSAAGFPIPPNILPGGGLLSPIQTLRCSAACLFSLGLCYQLDPNQTEQNTMVAMSLYQQAWTCLKDFLVDPSDSSILLSMAICMNFASCAQRLGQLEMARSWNDCLSTLLSFTNPEGPVDETMDATSAEASAGRTPAGPQTSTQASGQAQSPPTSSSSLHSSTYRPRNVYDTTTAAAHPQVNHDPWKRIGISSEVRHFFLVSTVLDGRSISAASA
eukprot:CAMPEP_0172441752 /NCGR_PEP_ID=MMETSP1065-20121228/2247_1 /TAXON_ID=265537 /ORGANISM="Amphiprora paludosa, Strain CCMP125" /LENGTH=361 /DNA_ID=CAMNT_0013191259 /DNA_START=228 /DNA_END=1313 /DNA_ORIENTATION=-